LLISKCTYATLEKLECRLAKRYFNPFLVIQTKGKMYLLVRAFTCLYVKLDSYHRRESGLKIKENRIEENRIEIKLLFSKCTYATLEKLECRLAKRYFNPFLVIQTKG
jgi:hypothetical protein